MGAMWVGIGMAALSMASGMMSGMREGNDQKAQAAQQAAQADVLRKQAVLERQKSERDAEAQDRQKSRIRREFKDVMARNQSVLGAGNVDMSSGSAMDTALGNINRFAYEWAQSSLAANNLSERVDIFLDSAFDRVNLLQALKDGLYEGSIGFASGFAIGGLHYIRPGQREKRDLINFVNDNRKLIAPLAEEWSRKAEESIHRGQLQNLFDEAAKAEGDPEARRQRINAALPDNLETMYVSPTDLAAMLDRHGEAALAAYGITAADAQKSMDNNLPLPVSTGFVLAHAEEMGEAGKDATASLRDGADGPSAEEARNWNPEETLRREAEAMLNGELAAGDYPEGTPWSERAAVSEAENHSRMDAALAARKERSRLAKEMRAAGLSALETSYISLAMYSHAMAFYRATGYDPAAYLGSISFVKGDENQISQNSNSTEANPESQINPSSLESAPNIKSTDGAAVQTGSSGGQPAPNVKLFGKGGSGGESPFARKRVSSPESTLIPPNTPPSPMDPALIKRGEARFSGERRIISIYGNRNVATAPHEFGHVAIDTLVQVASSEGRIAIEALRKRLADIGDGSLGRELEEALAAGEDMPVGTRLGMALRAWEQRAEKLRREGKQEKAAADYFEDVSVNTEINEKLAKKREELAAARREYGGLRAAIAMAERARRIWGEEIQAASAEVEAELAQVRDEAREEFRRYLLGGDFTAGMRGKGNLAGKLESLAGEMEKKAKSGRKEARKDFIRAEERARKIGKAAENVKGGLGDAGHKTDLRVARSYELAGRAARRAARKVREIQERAEKAAMERTEATWNQLDRSLERISERAPAVAREASVARLSGGKRTLDERMKSLIGEWKKRAKRTSAQAEKLDEEGARIAERVEDFNKNGEGARERREWIERDVKSLVAGARAINQALRHLEAVGKAREDIKAIARHAGLTKEEVQAVLAGDRGAAYIRLQEESARGFTQYLMEGKAPSQALAAAFRRYAEWLNAEYENHRDVLGAPISPECRAVFDRLLADEREIARYALINELKPMLAEIINNVEMSEKDRAKAGKAIENMANTLWASGLRDGIEGMENFRKKREARHMDSLAADPFWLVAETESLNYEDVERSLGKAAATRLAKARDGLVKPDGEPVERVRLKHGTRWADNDELLQELYDRLAKGRETREKTAKAMAEADVEARQRSAFVTRLGAVSDQSARVYELLDTILQKQILKKGGSVKDPKRLARQAFQQTIPREVIKGMAMELIANDRVGGLTFARFRAMLEKSLKDCAQSLKNGDIMAASNAFTRARMANELLAESRNAGADLARLRKFASRLIRSGEKYRKNYDDRALEAMRRVLAMTGLYGKRSFFDSNYAAQSLAQLTNSLNDTANGDDDHRYAPILPEWLINQKHPETGKPITPSQPLHLEELTATQLADIMNFLRFLQKKGRDLRADAKANRQSFIKNLVNGTVERLKGLSPFRTNSAASAMARAEDVISKFIAHADYFDFQIRRADGLTNPLGRGEAGPMEMGPMRALHKATDRCRTRKQKLLTELAPHLIALSDSMKKLIKRDGRYIRGEDGNILRPPALYVERFRQKGLEPDQILAMALNCGNESNMSRLMDGYPDYTYDDFANVLGDDVAAQIQDAWLKNQEIRETPKRVNRGRKGVLSTADWLHIQAIWDVFASQWPEISATYRREYGFAPNRLPIHPLRVPSANGPTTLRGGYYPVHYDSRLSPQIAKWTQTESLLHSNEALFQGANPKKNFTKDRSEKAAGYPLLLSTAIITQHVNEVATFIDMAHDALIMWDILRDPDFRAAYSRVYGQHEYEAFKSTLKSTLRPEPAPRNDAIYDMARLARKFLIPWGLGFNPKVAVIQQTALFQGMNDVGAKEVLRSMAFMTRHPVAAIRAVMAVSPYMAARVKSVENDLTDMSERLASPNQWAFEIGGRRVTHETLVNLSLAPITCSDMLASTAVWLGAFNKRLAMLLPDASIWTRQAARPKTTPTADATDSATTADNATTGIQTASATPETATSPKSNATAAQTATASADPRQATGASTPANAAAGTAASAASPDIAAKATPDAVNLKSSSRKTPPARPTDPATAANMELDPDATDLEDQGNLEAAAENVPGLFAGLPVEIFEECVAFADSIVMNANPDYDPINRSGFLRSKGAGYAFNMFASAVMRIFARWRIMKESLRQKTISLDEYRRYAAYEFWAPGVAMSLFFLLIGGYWKDDPKEWAKVMVSNMMDQQLLRVPIVGSAIKTGLLGMMGLDSGFQSSLRGAAPTVFEQPLNTLRHLFLDLTDSKDFEEKARELGWNAFETISLLSRVPVAPLARKISRGWEQYRNGQGTPASILVPRPEKTKKQQPTSYYNLRRDNK